MTQRAGCLAILLVGCLGGDLLGCSIPVFRYALERWQPSPYRVFVFHRSPLTDAQRALVKGLQDPAVPMNVDAQAIDLADEISEESARIWKRHGKPDRLPWVVALYPEEDEKAPLAWSGTLDRTALDRMADSPMRQNLVRLLTRGASAVWLLLESGDSKADSAALALLKGELTRLQKAIELPEQRTDDPESQLRSRLPLRVDFPILRLNRSSADEAVLVRLLLESEDGLSSVKGPIVFPIFGRGRVLQSLHGEQLTAPRLDYCASFLCAPCSCKVKEANPGVDLILRADWDGLLQTEAPAEKAQAPLPSPAIPPGEPNLLCQVGVPITAEPEPASNRWLYPAVGMSGLFVLLTGAWVVWKRSLAG